MTPDSARYLKLLEHRLGLLSALTDVLRQSRDCFVLTDLSAMERSIAEQAQLCARIRLLDTEISSTQARCAERIGQAAPAGTIGSPTLPDAHSGHEQIRVVLSRIAAAQSELKKINDAHQSMLRRSRRTVQVLLNLFDSFAPTYSAPQSVGSTYEERA